MRLEMVLQCRPFIEWLVTYLASEGRESLSRMYVLDVLAQCRRVCKGFVAHCALCVFVVIAGEVRFCVDQPQIALGAKRPSTAAMRTAIRLPMVFEVFAQQMRVREGRRAALGRTLPTRLRRRRRRV